MFGFSFGRVPWEVLNKILQRFSKRFLYLSDLYGLYIHRAGEIKGAGSASKDRARDRLIKFDIEIEVRYLRASRQGRGDKRVGGSPRMAYTCGRTICHFVLSWATRAAWPTTLQRLGQLPLTMQLCTALSIRPANPRLGQTYLRPPGNFWRVRRQRTALIGLEHPLPCDFEI